jgi:transposase-like protein
MTEKGLAATKRRIFSREFKLQVRREIEAGTKTQAQAAREYQLSDTAIYNWRKEYSQYKDRAFAGRGHAYTDEARISELERMVGRLTMENEFLKKLLQKLETES